MPLPPLKVLHLFSNSKWTGPAEPVVNACRTLKELGVDITFACSPKAGSGFNKVRFMADSYEISCLDFMYLSKHRHPWKNTRDKWTLARHLSSTSYDLIHCHLDNDHLIASRVARKKGLPLVRSSYEGVGFPKKRRYKRLLQKTDLLLSPSHMAREADEQNFGFPSQKAVVIPGVVDTARFKHDPSLPDMRLQWGLGTEHFIFGIVARMQTHRHYEDLFQAFHKLLQEYPQARLVIVGRGTHQERVAFEPVRRLQIEKEVIFTGYLEEENYTGALAAMDAGIYLTPGSDGTCRAVRELMAMAVPLVSSDRGMLPELVGHDQRGLVTDGTPQALYEALELMIRDESRRKRYSEEAEKHGRKHFSLQTYGTAILEAYNRLLSR
ncbi:MAG: glycosyltransferase family 4 protein [Candidatus Hydrogenedens sp.]|nr:glycosyltransferase family 4 protein [Candidatus Hydrogenedens sp.]